MPCLVKTTVNSLKECAGIPETQLPFLMFDLIDCAKQELVTCPALGFPDNEIGGMLLLLCSHPWML